MHGLAVAGVLLRRSGPQQQVGAGQLIGEGGEVLGAHAPLIQTVHPLLASQLLRPAGDLLHQGGIVHQRRRGGDLLHRGAATEGRRRVLRDGLDALHDPGGEFPVKGADGALQHGLLWDDVGGLSPLKPAHRHHGRLLRGDLPCGQLLQGEVDVGGDIDGVHAGLRHGPVAAGAPDGDPEQGAARHERPPAAEHHAGGSTGVDVEGQRRLGRRRILQDPGFQYGLGPGEALLIRLEHQPHRTLQVRLMPLE